MAKGMRQAKQVHIYIYISYFASHFSMSLTLIKLVITKIIIYTTYVKALLNGCSAGGLAAILQCDDFNNLFPPTTKVKCMSDAGFFLDA